MKLKTPLKLVVLGLTTVSLMGGLTSCNEVPLRTLNNEEKAADLMWLYSKYGENYAPLNYKQEKHGFNYEQIKKDYLLASTKTTTNNEFYDLMFKFVAEFKDAHNSAALSSGQHAGRAQVAFLGFSGIRNGDALLVKQILPTITSDSGYPIKKDDLITKIDGVALKDFIKSDLLPLRNLGNEETNYTFHMNKIFTRLSTRNGLPNKQDAELTVMRGDEEFTFVLPWVVKDLKQFQDEQEKAAEPTAALATTSAIADTTKSLGFMLTENNGQDLFKFNFVSFNGTAKSLNNIMLNSGLSKLMNRFTHEFKILDDISEWNFATKDAATKTPMEALADQRWTMGVKNSVDGAKIFPAYIGPQVMKDKDGKEIKTVNVGYIYIDSFSPNATEPDAVAELRSTLDRMLNFGVEHLVIDTINNGGGSLVLGMKMAQQLTTKAVELPKLEFKLSDSWITEFKDVAENGPGESEKVKAARIVADMEKRRDEHMLLSSAFSAGELAPFKIVPPSKTVVKKSFKKVVLLVNEMCASMCDIFAGMLQDNKLATIVGTRTMGAGGNVVNYSEAPNSFIEVRQTESLILRKDGSYIENNGVTPDVEVVVNTDAKNKYSTVIKAGIDVLLDNPRPADKK